MKQTSCVAEGINIPYCWKFYPVAQEPREPGTAVQNQSPILDSKTLTFSRLFSWELQKHTAQQPWGATRTLCLIILGSHNYDTEVCRKASPGHELEHVGSEHFPVTPVPLTDVPYHVFTPAGIKSI